MYHNNNYYIVYLYRLLFKKQPVDQDNFFLQIQSNLGMKFNFINDNRFHIIISPKKYSGRSICLCV